MVDEIYNISLNLRKNHSVEVSYEAKNPAKHLKQADSSNSKIFLCLGDDEYKSGQIWYKNLENGDDKKINLENLNEVINAR